VRSGLRSAVALRLDRGEPDYRKIGERGTDGGFVTLAGDEALPRQPATGSRLRVPGAGMRHAESVRRLRLAAVRLCRRLQRGTTGQAARSQVRALVLD
jgi:hypothetical protein